MTEDLGRAVPAAGAARPKRRAGVLALLLAAAMLAPVGSARATQPPLFDLYVRGQQAPYFGMLLLYWLVFPSIVGGDDPAIIGAGSRHGSWTRDVNGAISESPGSRTDTISTMIWGGYDFSNALGLPPNQRFVVGGFYRHDWFSSTQPAIADTSGDNNALGLIVAYHFNNWHLAGAFELSWGDATVTGINNTNQGSYDSGGHAFGFQAGHVFTLWGEPRPTARADVPWAYQLKQASIYLDPVFRFGYGRTHADAFTLSGGATVGKEVERAWLVGGGVTLSAVIPEGSGTIWRPYISFNLDRQVGYRHTIDLPATSQVAHLDHDKTYWGVNGGVAVWLNPRLSLGVSGFYRGSGSEDVGGGLFWVRVNLFGPGGYLRGGMQNR